MKKEDVIRRLKATHETLKEVGTMQRGVSFMLMKCFEGIVYDNNDHRWDGKDIAVSYELKSLAKEVLENTEKTDKFEEEMRDLVKLYDKKGRGRK